jgi:hypothetical protein
MIGYVEDLDNINQAVSIEVRSNGEPVQTIVADRARPELVESGRLHKPNHGFEIPIAALNLAPGEHSITLIALDPITGDEVSIGEPFAITIAQPNPPTGQLEVVDETTISGWAYDSDDPRQTQVVELIVDGEWRASLTADQARPDLVESGRLPEGSPNHGFQFATADLALEYGNHEISARAADAVTGQAVVLATRNLMLWPPRPTTAELCEPSGVRALNGLTVSHNIETGFLEIVGDTANNLIVLRTAPYSFHTLLVNDSNDGTPIVYPCVSSVTISPGAGNNTVDIYEIMLSGDLIRNSTGVDSVNLHGNITTGGSLVL